MRFEGEQSYTYLGLSQSLELSGDTKFDVSMGLSLLDPTGYGRMFIALFSPEKSFSLSGVYTLASGEQYHAAIERFRQVFDSWVRARSGIGQVGLTLSGVTSPPEVLVVLAGGYCLRFRCYPVTMSVELKSGEPTVVRFSLRAVLAGVSVEPCPQL